MILDFISDIHLSHYKQAVSEPSKHGDTLVVAGDIDGDDIQQSIDWLLSQANNYKHVVVVLGNHDYYGSTIEQTNKKWTDHQEVLTSHNIHVLINRTIVIDDVLFIGTTLWSDIYAQGNSSAYRCKKLLNDFRQIKQFTLSKYQEAFKTNLAWLDTQLSLQSAGWEKRIVVITHHLPSFKCIHNEYKSSPINVGFASSLDNTHSQFFNGNVDVWIHGHTHKPIDTMIGQTRVLCNPRGYPNENEKVEIQTINI